MANAVSYFALWHFEQEDNIMGKVAKGKEKTHDKKTFFNLKFHERNVNALHFYVRILSCARCTQNMQLIRNYRENYS